MTRDSFASYQSALPIEARVGGEPDDDLPPVSRVGLSAPSSHLRRRGEVADVRVSRRAHDLRPSHGVLRHGAVHECDRSAGVPPAVVPGRAVGGSARPGVAGRRW